MPRKGTKHRNWSPNNMKMAVQAIRNKEMGYLKASKVYSVPKSTLEDYVKRHVDVDLDNLKSIKVGRKPALNEVMERDLVSYCLEMDRRFHGLGCADVRRLAYQLALKNGVNHQFPVTGQAGKKWLKNFLRRNPELSLRKPQGVSKGRIKGFTPEKVAQFFDHLEPAMAKINHNPSRVYNVDETGITTVLSKFTRVLTLKGKKQVGALTAAERGALITVVMCMNAAGGFVPPLFVFPRKNMKPELLDGAPPGSIAACHPSGWIQSHIFTQWLHHFIKYVKPNQNDPVLLILDGHYSHTRNLDVIDLARSSYIVCLPPHTSHKMQPIDLAFMSPFKTYYSCQIQMWLRSNPGRNLTSYQICKLMCPAYLKAATAEISVNGFRKSGIFPMNRDIFTEADFLIERQRERTPPDNDHDNGAEPHSFRGDTTPPLGRVVSQQITPPRKTPKSPCSSSAEVFVKITDFSPLPSCSTTTNVGSKSRQGSSSTITSTPYKNDLEASVREQERKASLKNKKKKIDAELQQKKKVTKKSTKEAKADSDSSDSEELILDDDSDMDAEDDQGNETECLFCAGLFSEDTRGEKWIRCMKCFRWAHEDCTDGSRKKYYICDFCLHS